MSAFLITPAFDADGGEGGGDTGTPASDGKAADKEELTTEQQLEAEFGDGSAPTDDDDDSDPDDGTGNDDDADEDEDDNDEGDDANADDKDGDGNDDDESGDDDESEGADKDKNQEPSEATKALTERAEKAEREAAEARAALEKAGISLDAADSEAAPPEEPDPSKYEFGEHDQQYIKDVAKYEAKMEIMVDQAKTRFKAEATALEAKWTKNLVTATEKYPDFDEVVVKGGEEKKWPCPPVVALGIKDSEYGPDIAYSLAKNVDEANRIAKLSPLEQAREFGRLEEREAVKADRAKRRAERETNGEKQPRRITKAPTPPKRQVRGSGGRTNVQADTDDFSAFEKMVDAKQASGR